jgi:hypothetical protein
MRVCLTLVCLAQVQGPLPGERAGGWHRDGAAAHRQARAAGEPSGAHRQPGRAGREHVWPSGSPAAVSAREALAVVGCHRTRDMSSRSHAHMQAVRNADVGPLCHASLWP